MIAYWIYKIVSDGSLQIVITTLPLMITVQIIEAPYAVDLVARTLLPLEARDPLGITAFCARVNYRQNII